MFGYFICCYLLFIEPQGVTVLVHYGSMFFQDFYKEFLHLVHVGDICS